MRRLCVLGVWLFSATLPGVCLSAETFHYDDPQIDVACGGEAEGLESGCWDSCDASCGRSFYCQTCRRLPKRAVQNAEIGSFNCTCRGSYNYPVPPQYTYHWPGMYAQQTIIEYASPWRFPSLEQYHWGGASVGEGSDRTVQLPRPPTLDERGF